MRLRYKAILKMSSPSALFVVSLCMLLYVSVSSDKVVQRVGQVCTFFGNRVSAPESSLVNCSWYASNACCKRTEVTSVFSGMYKLYGASKACRNRMNYLMCYFCSPEQHLWYDNKATICSEFCNDVYEQCKTASYNGVKLGDEYQSGDELCRAQNFGVKSGKDECFSFDPWVFDHSTLLSHSWALLLICVVGLLCNCL